MNNTYKISETGIKEILDKVDSFVNNMEKFKLKYGRYNYIIVLNNNNDKWSAKIKITNGKQEGDRVPDSVI